MLTIEEVNSFRTRILDTIEQIKVLSDSLEEHEGFKKHEYYSCLSKFWGLVGYAHKLLRFFSLFIQEEDYIILVSELSVVRKAFEEVADKQTTEEFEKNYNVFIGELNRAIYRFELNISKSALGAQFEMINSRVSNVEELKTNLRNYAEDLKKSTMDDMRHQYSQNKTNVLDSLNESTEEIRRRVSESEGAISNFKAKFDDHTNMLFNLEVNIDRQVSGILDKTSEQIISGVNDIKIKSETNLKSIEGSRKKAETLLGIIGNLGLAGNFKSIANKEGKSAFFMRIGTISFLLIGVLFAIFSMWDFIHSFTNHLTVNAATTAKTGAENQLKIGVVPSPTEIWAVLVLRVVTTFIILAPAVYFAKESNKHRENSDRSERIEAELISLLAFIEDMDKCDRDEVRKKLSDRYFVGNRQEINKDKDTGLPIEFVQKTIEKIVNKSVDVFGDVVNRNATTDKSKTNDLESSETSTSKT